MRKLFFLIAFFFYALIIQAQSNLSPAILASGGGIAKFPGIELEWTLGETSIGTTSTSNRFYTVGFHQPILLSRSYLQDEVANSTGVLVYPNPVENILSVQFKLAKYNGAKLILSDLQGRAILERTVNGKISTSEIPVHQLISGVYLLRISDIHGNLIDTYKIIKAN